MTRNEFIEKVAELAKADTRILPSLTIAQAILESGWGNSGLTIRANALFGIKAGKSWKGKVYSAKTQECYDGVNFVSETAVFRAYDSWAESVQDHTEFLCGLKRYAKVVGEKDYRKACEAIQAAGYATDPTYANKLVSLIVRHGLTKYDPAATDQEKTDTAATYKVKSGDTLGEIAKEHGTTVAAIVAANKAKYPKITADYIQTGWTLTV